MALVTMRQLLDEVAKGDHGVGAFNVNNLEQYSGEFDTRYYLKLARAAMQEVVKARMEAFGQAGHAKDYDPVSLADRAVRYKEQGHQLTTA